MDTSFNDPKQKHRKFYIAKVNFTVDHGTIQEVKRPPKRRYIL